MAPLFDLLDFHFEHKIIHSGQHYDRNLNLELFKELQIKSKIIRLKTGSGNFSIQFNLLIKKIFHTLENENPDYVIVHGDTNTSLAGAIVAARLKIKVIHIEAGCRSGNINSPEEQNRLLIDSISTLLFCPNPQSYKNISINPLNQLKMISGSTNYDAFKRSLKILYKSYNLSVQHSLPKYAVLTLHRSENLEDIKSFRKKIIFLNQLSKHIKIIFPAHPRTRKFLKINSIKLEKNISLITPLSHLQFLKLLKDSFLVITDSGGIQEESVFLNKPCIVLRQETEWKRFIDIGKNFLFTRQDKNEFNLLLKLIYNNKFYEKSSKLVVTHPKNSCLKIIKYIKRSYRYLKNSNT